jgi:hypothetical protein
MTREPNKNPAASIRAKLLSLSREKGEDYQRVLGRFAIERFLYRLGISTYRDRFVLKGATLFTLWTGETHRPTKDLDLLGWGSSVIADVEQVFRDICEITEDDGIVFDSQSVEGTTIKENDEYNGVHIKFRAELAGAQITLQVDIGFGDAVSRSRSWRLSLYSCQCQRRSFELTHGRRQLRKSCTRWFSWISATAA